MDRMHIIGAVSSAVLVVGMVAQVVRQWREGSSKGVSLWFPVAQLVANMGFAWYGASIGDVVVMLTGSAMALCSVAGLILVLHHRFGRKRHAEVSVRSAASEPDPSAHSMRVLLPTHVGE